MRKRVEKGGRQCFTKHLLCVKQYARDTADVTSLLSKR